MQRDMYVLEKDNIAKCMLSEKGNMDHYCGVGGNIRWVDTYRFNLRGRGEGV